MIATSLTRQGNGIFSLTSGSPGILSIDLTSPVLDSRVTYTGPAHAYRAANGMLALSAVNEWPLEFIAGVPVGRHEPEAAAVNLTADIYFDQIDTKWYRQTRVAGENATPTPGISIDGNGGLRMPAGWSKGAFYANNAFVLPDSTAWQNSNFDGGWQRALMSPNVTTTDAQARAYFGRQDAPNHMYGYCAVTPGQHQMSVFRKSLTVDGSDKLDLSLPQVERGNFPTSPIMAADGNRAAASVTVARMPGTQGVKVVARDGSSFTLSFGAAQSVTIPLSALPWASRYLAVIEYT